MNKLWVRISLTIVGIIIFFVMCPLTFVIGRQSFDFSDPDFRDRIEQRYPDQWEWWEDDKDHNGFDGNIPGVFIIGALFQVFFWVTLISILAGALISRGLTRPLDTLASAAQAIGKNDLTQRVDVRGSAEIRAVARSFNEMADALEEAETLRSNLLADVAHELRTPLTVLQGNLRAILDDVYELDKAEIARLYDQTRHLTRLVNDLRELAQVEAEQLPLNITNVDVHALVQETADIFTPIAKAEDKTLVVDIAPTLPPIRGDAARLTQCIQNLLHNALQHTQAEGTITLRTMQNNEGVCIQVQDDGAGIEAEHLPHIFDRFYRSDRARSRDTGGTGLGLAIVRAMVDAQGGSIRVESDGIGQGSTFTIQLPTGLSE
jgi:signal transduction histidine kinase